jgi:hypothetical protein
MRRTLGMLGMLAVVSAGVVACDDTQGITTIPLGFTIAEGLLLVTASDPTAGTVVFAANAGNCPAFQAGAQFNQILLSDFLTFGLAVQDGSGNALPLTAGTYNISPPPLPAGAGLFSFSTEYETTAECAYSPTGANSGTITVQPFDPSANGGSNGSFSVVFGYDQFNGGFGLSTCVLPTPVPVLGADGGPTCLYPGTLE